MNKSSLASLLAFALGAVSIMAGNPVNPILFVTQVPMPEEVNSRDITVSYQSCVSPFSNHLADTAHAGRGGSLWVRFSDGTLVDLLAVADWSAISGGKPAAGTVAVRNPAVNWAATKAIFSMVIGVPSGPTDATTFLWQLYEITLPTQAQLAANTQPVLTKVASQPAYNNIMPCYALGGKIVFASDRPYNGQPHLTQREEYLGLPTVSGLWTLDPADPSTLQILHHSPSGAFSPSVDSAGRLIFTNWDHLSRDSLALQDSRPPATAAPYNETFTQTTNGSGNFASEQAAAVFTPVTAMPVNSFDIFPEPRSFDKKTLIDVFGGNLNGNAFNVFLPWMVNLDGSGLEIINHAGRHELGGAFTKSFKNDAAIVDLNPAVNPNYGGMGVRTFFDNLQWTREDPQNPGVFFGADAPDLGTHGAGQIVKITNGGPGGNPDTMQVIYVTGGAGGKAKPGGLPLVRPSINLPATGLNPLAPQNAEQLYRTPVPLADGNLVASHSAATQTDYNTGTLAQPATNFAFRLRSLKLVSGTWVPDVALTSGLNITASYYVGSTLVSYSGAAWELDPAEVVARTAPAASTEAIDPIESAVFTANGVDVPTFQKYLRSINAALSVSRDVTKRDKHDRQQPFNLKIAWSNTQTVAPGTSGLYTVGWVQFLEADLRRGYLIGGANPAAGRRAVPTPLYQTLAENVVAPGAPAGSLKLGDDGSFAAILPAGKALTWHLLDNDAAKTSQVKERFWVTFKSGEIRTCANCHGINTGDQAGATKPTNSPAALDALLKFWKGSHPSGTLQLTSATANVAAGAGAATLYVSRAAGSTGPVAVNYATVDGTAKAGVDFLAPTNGQLTWADGDTASKPITVNLLLNGAATTRSFDVVLSNPLNGALGAQTTATVTLPVALAAPAAKIVATKGAAIGTSADHYGAAGAPQAGAFNGDVVTGKVRTRAIFAGDGSVRVKAGDTLASGEKISKLGAVNGDAALATLALAPGSVTAANDSVLLAGLLSGPVRIAAREGIAFANLAGVSVKTFLGFDGNGATSFFLAKLQGSGVDASNDTALCAALPDGSARVLVRKGQAVGQQTVTTIATLVGAKGTIAEGRWRVSGTTFGVRLTLANKQQALYSVPDNANTSADWTRWAGTGDSVGNGEQIGALGLPGFGANGPAFVAELVDANHKAVANPAAVFRADANGLTLLARHGGTAPGTGLPFVKFGDPVSGSGGKTAFAASVSGAKGAAKSGLWYAADGVTVTLLARGGDAAPGGGKWARFSSLALPDGGLGGPLFLATLVVDPKAGITAKDKSGLWAVDVNGTTQLLARTGQNLTIGGAAHHLKSFTALLPSPGSVGAASGYTFSDVALGAVFDTGAPALITLPLP